MYKFQCLSQLPRQIFRFVFGKGLPFAYTILENITADSTENYFRMSDFLYLTLQCFNGQRKFRNYDDTIIQFDLIVMALCKLHDVCFKLNDVGMKIKLSSFM